MPSQENENTDGQGDGHSMSVRTSATGDIGKSGDLFYRALTDWTTKSQGRDQKLARECLMLGTAYLQALNKLLDLPLRRRSGDGLEMNQLRAQEYKALLERDLAMLERILSDGQDGARLGDGDGR